MTININQRGYASEISESTSSSGAQSSQQKTGNLGGFSVTVNNEVDPTTKDDEVLSGFQAEKNTKNEQIKKGKENTKTRVHNVSQIKDPESAIEQSQQMRRLQKNTELRLQQMGNERFQHALHERSGKLFEGSEDKYESAYNKINDLPSNATPTNYLNTVESEFTDIAEQHNALQMAAQAFTAELALLEGGRIPDSNKAGSMINVAGELNIINRKLDALAGKDSAEDNETRARLLVERNVVSERISTLRAKQTAINSAIGNLMDKNGPRIEDSYKLAPELNKAIGGSKEKSSLMTSKDLNSLILDKALPLNGNVGQLSKLFFDEILSNADKNNENVTLSPEEMVSNFTNNLTIVTDVLSKELNNLQSIRNLSDSEKVIGAIMQTMRITSEFGSIFSANTSFVSQINKTIFAN